MIGSMNNEINIEERMEFSRQTGEPQIVAMFRALGDPVRLGIFEFLQKCTKPVASDEQGGVHRLDGPTVGEVCCHITGADKITSTISHHLKELRIAGLICVERRGRNMICSVNREAVNRLAQYLHDSNMQSHNRAMRLLALGKIASATEEPASGKGTNEDGNKCCPPNEP